MSRRGAVKAYLGSGGKGGQVSSLTRRGWTVVAGGDAYQVKATSPKGRVFRFWPASEFWQAVGQGPGSGCYGKSAMIEAGEA